MKGQWDTVSANRHPFLFPPPGTVAPSAPPWFGEIKDNHTDLGNEDGAEKINNIAGESGGRVVPFPSRRLQGYETYEVRLLILLTTPERPTSSF